MRYEIYQIYDKKAGINMRPFICSSDLEAKRACIAQLANDNFLYANAEDYELLFVCCLFDKIDEFVEVESSRKVVNLSELKVAADNVVRAERRFEDEKVQDATE